MREKFSGRLSPAACMVLLALAGCGGAEGLELTISISQALSPDVDRVSLLVFGSEVSCVGLDADPEYTYAQPDCRVENRVGCIHTRDDISPTDTEPGFTLFVSEGRRYIYGMGFDTDGAIIATGCNGPLDVEDGKKLAIRMTLD